MKKWNIINKSQIPNSKLQKDELINLLLENRNIKTKKEREDFLTPDLKSVTLDSVKIDKAELKKTIKRIQTAIKNGEQIIVFGDYDVDGICGTAILWETLNKMGAKVMPYIPSRFEEGYGLSINGISNSKSQIPNLKLIITVDNGIVANEAVEYAKKQGIDVIITDHHVPSKKLPNAFSIVHTTNLCGAGVAYLLSQELRSMNYESRIKEENHLELVVLATIADLVPLTKENRTLVYFGLEKLRETKRLGLLALFKSASLEKNSIGVYEIGHMIAPRLNAMGRLESAMDSLRLICTTNAKRAEDLATLLSVTNKERQDLTQGSVLHAKTRAKDKLLNKLLFIADESYQQGIIGLVAGRLVEEFYLPSIVISKGEKYSKASVRSVKGFNIIEFLREASDLLVDVGGHPMAAGFTVETEKLDLLEKRLIETASKLIKKETLTRVLNIDLELPVELVNLETYSEIQKLSPFGMANPEPTFMTKDLEISDVRTVGRDGKHLRIRFRIQNSEFRIEGIYFGGGENNKLKIGDKVSVVYTMEIDEWLARRSFSEGGNGSKKLQIKIKDIKIKS